MTAIPKLEAGSVPARTTSQEPAQSNPISGLQDSSVRVEDVVQKLQDAEKELHLAHESYQTALKNEEQAKSALEKFKEIPKLAGEFTSAQKETEAVREKVDKAMKKYQEASEDALSSIKSSLAQTHLMVLNQGKR